MDCAVSLKNEDMVWAVRFELTISCFRRTQDGHLPYAHANDGCGERIRTAACTAYEAAALPLGDTASMWSATSDSNAHVVMTAGSEAAGSTNSPSRRWIGSFLERVGIEPTTQCLRGIVAWPWYMPSHSAWPGVRRSHPRLDGFNVALQLSQLTPDGVLAERPGIEPGRPLPFCALGSWGERRGSNPCLRLHMPRSFHWTTNAMASPVGIEPTSRVLESLSSPRLGLVVGPLGANRTRTLVGGSFLDCWVYRFPHERMASTVRLERTSSRVTAARTTRNLCYVEMAPPVRFERTTTRLRRPALYPLSYGGMKHLSFQRT